MAEGASFWRIARYKPPASATPEARLIEAALELFAVRPYREVTFREVLDYAHVNRATAYRLHPGGLDSLVETLHRKTVHEILLTSFSHVAQAPSTKYREVLVAGISGALQGLKETPWTGEVLWRDRDLLTAYLLNRGEGSVFWTLAGFATWCAERRGADPRKVYPYAEEVVWEVFSVALRSLSDTPDQPPDWPADESDPRLTRVVSKFIKQSGISQSVTTGPIIDTELLPDSRPAQMPVADALALGAL